MSDIADPFLTQSLRANQNGQLTDQQRRNLGSYERDRHQAVRRWALIPLAIAAIILFVPGASTRPMAHYGVPLVCVILAIGLVIWSLGGLDRLARDLRDGRVESLEGAIGKRSVGTGNSRPGSTLHFLDVGDHSFRVGRSTYEAAPDAGHVRIYYLPRSERVVNLERLEGHPAAGLAGPQDVRRLLTSALAERDRVQRNEARAEVQAMADEMNAYVLHDPVPPSGAITGARELADALVGSWHNPMLTLTFQAAGTVEASPVIGKKHSGHWSVENDRRLRTDVMGQEGTADAWIRGDQLTISLDGTSLTFDRVTS